MKFKTKLLLVALLVGGGGVVLNSVTSCKKKEENSPTTTSSSTTTTTTTKNITVNATVGVTCGNVALCSGSDRHKFYIAGSTINQTPTSGWSEIASRDCCCCGFDVYGSIAGTAVAGDNYYVFGYWAFSDATTGPQSTDPKGSTTITVTDIQSTYTPSKIQLTN